MANTLYLVRGLPGSGKNYFATHHLLLKDYEILSADDYFMVGREYRFDESKISEAHKDCEARTRVKLAKHDRYDANNFYSGARLAVCNTFTRRWEMDAYYTMAAIFGWNVVEIAMKPHLTLAEMHARQQHGVSMEKMIIFQQNWEN